MNVPRQAEPFLLAVTLDVEGVGKWKQVAQVRCANPLVVTQLPQTLPVYRSAQKETDLPMVPASEVLLNCF